MPEDAVLVTERGYRESCLGRVLQLKVCTADYRPLYWREVWDVFSARYPGRWAVQCFPPADALTDGKAVYHLWVMEEGAAPQGLDIRA